MKTHQQAGSLAIAIAAFAMACADPSGPTVSMTEFGSPVAAVTDAIRGVNGFAYPTGMTAGEVRVCKSVPTGDPAGVQFSFSVTVVGVVGGALGPTTTNHNIVGVPGSSTACTDVFLSAKPGDGLDSVRIVETAPPANWALTAINTLRIDDGPGYTPPNSGPNSGDLVVENVGTRSVSLYINGDMGRIVTFTNDHTAPPPDICTYTKGWYQNKNGAPTVIAVDGRTIAQAQAIFEASPGQPGSVTWGVGALTDNKPNNLLNLYQQFLAALQNLGGDANEDLGPTAVDNAIDAVQAATGGTGLHISLVAGTDVSALINTLSAFNQGEFAGVPHCSDEVLSAGN